MIVQNLDYPKRLPPPPKNKKHLCQKKFIKNHFDQVLLLYCSIVHYLCSEKIDDSHFCSSSVAQTHSLHYVSPYSSLLHVGAVQIVHFLS